VAAREGSALMGWEQKGGVYVFVPKEEPPRFRCTVIVNHDDGENTICGEPFWSVEALAAHAANCARKHQDAIQKAAPSNRLPDWLTQRNVTDWEDWLDEADAAGETNRSKVIAGRKKF
jgi:hypothetical protein